MYRESYKWQCILFEKSIESRLWWEAAQGYVLGTYQHLQILEKGEEA
jgi:hypothetical protein